MNSSALTLTGADTWSLDWMIRTIWPFSTLKPKLKLWLANTGGHPEAYATLTEMGNLAVYAEEPATASNNDDTLPKILWESNTKEGQYIYVTTPIDDLDWSYVAIRRILSAKATCSTDSLPSGFFSFRRSRINLALTTVMTLSSLCIRLMSSSHKKRLAHQGGIGYASGFNDNSIKSFNSIGQFLEGLIIT